MLSSLFFAPISTHSTAIAKKRARVLIMKKYITFLHGDKHNESLTYHLLCVCPVYKIIDHKEKRVNEEEEVCAYIFTLTFMMNKINHKKEIKSIEIRC